MSGAEIAKAVLRAGFGQVSMRGSHAKYRHPEGRTVIVPMHRALAPGTLRSVPRQVEWSVEQLEPHLK
ncbi:type II toxin-antitoxin system HicA family toxin [Streptacidiphilus sp. P02-A3a]|uniref:type II toxin-antitoxin system HicA family toxin n=1 Tax=Streptacidiphilus sp. P02-A3a TaxID=2704468 RepID=UPI001CDC94A8|nr:type II toxin-antitoxin system HicA family toxin [Streptacidiphilus sp. P02-A3a]